MDCCGRKRATKISPMKPPPPSPPKHLKGNSSRNFKLALEGYRISHPNVLIVDSPSCGLDKREMITYKNIDDG